SAKKSVSSGSRTSCASVLRCPYQLMTLLKYEITACASGGAAAVDALSEAGLEAAAGLAAAVTSTFGAGAFGEMVVGCGLCASALAPRIAAIAVESAIASPPASRRRTPA